MRRPPVNSRDLHGSIETPKLERPTAARGRSGGFGKDVLKLVSGTVAAQAITLVLSPLGARYFGWIVRDDPTLRSARKEFAGRRVTGRSNG
jgi:hypothetical protein